MWSSAEPGVRAAGEPGPWLELPAEHDRPRPGRRSATCGAVCGAGLFAASAFAPGPAGIVLGRLGPLALLVVSACWVVLRLRHRSAERAWSAAARAFIADAERCHAQEREAQAARAPLVALIASGRHPRSPPPAAGPRAIAVGACDLPSAVRVRGAPTTDRQAELRRRAEVVAGATRILELRRAIGVAGPGVAAAAVARGLAIQIASAGGGVRVHVAETAETLPAECEAIVEVIRLGLARIRADPAETPFVPELVSVPQSRRLIGPAPCPAEEGTRRTRPRHSA